MNNTLKSIMSGINLAIVYTIWWCAVFAYHIIKIYKDESKVK